MSRRVAATAAIALGGIVAFAGCETGSRCPQTIADARALTYDDEIIAGGYAIRFIPSPDDPAFRGYDVNLTIPISERARSNTYLLRVDAPIPGIVDGMPVLVMAERQGPGSALVPGLCPALTPVTEEEVGP